MVISVPKIFVNVSSKMWSRVFFETQRKNYEDMFIRFDRIHEHDGRTDIARRHRPRLCIASRGKNLQCICIAQ